MNTLDQDLLEKLQYTLSERVNQHHGLLSAPEVLWASRELDLMVLRFMRWGRDR